MREKECFPVVTEIDVNNGPIGGIAATEDGRSVIATNSSGDSVSIVDTRAGTVSTIPGIPEPLSLAVGGRDRACISSASATCDALAVLDLRAKTVVAVHPVAFHVTDVAVSPNTRQAYCSVTADGRAGVAALDTTTGAGDIVTISAAPGTTADSVRISPDGRRLYLAVHGASSDQLVLMESHRLRVTGSVEIGSPIRDVAVSSNGSTVYVASCSPDFGAVLDVIDTRSGMVAGTAKITGVGGFVTQLSLSTDGERVYLVNDHGVTVLSTATLEVICTVTVGGSPSCVVETAGGTRLCIADYAGMFTVVSTPSHNVRADDITARHEWALPELLEFAPALA